MNLNSPDKAPPAAADPRAITVERKHDAEVAKGTVRLRNVPAPNAGPSVHVKLAGSRAWLNLGEKRVAAKDWTGAIACAEAGLAELGDKYAGPDVEDDTQLKLYAAQDQLAKGKAQNAASVMLNMLSIRIRLYTKLHAGEIAD